MRVRFTFKHMASSRALIEVAESKLANLARRFKPQPHHVAVTVDTDGPLKKMRASLVTQDGRDIEAVVRGNNIFTLVDDLVQKLDGQLRRRKGRKNIFKNNFKNKWSHKFRMVEQMNPPGDISNLKPFWIQSPIDAAEIMSLPPAQWGPLESGRAS